MEFVGSRDIPTAFVEPRDFYNNKGIEIWTHSPNCPSLGDLAEFSDFSRLKLDCNEHVSDGNMFPERSRSVQGVNMADVYGPDVADADCEHAYNGYDGDSTPVSTMSATRMHRQLLERLKAPSRATWKSRSA